MGYGQRQLKAGHSCHGSVRGECRRKVTKWRRLMERRYLQMIMDGIEDGENIPPKPRFIGYY